VFYSALLANIRLGPNALGYIAPLQGRYICAMKKLLSILLIVFFFVTDQGGQVKGSSQVGRGLLVIDARTSSDCPTVSFITLAPAAYKHITIVNDASSVVNKR
jgi:hypothetical protein